jgi:hypothetical protein
VPEVYRFPGYLSPADGLKFSDVPNGIEAIAAVPFLGWLQIWGFVGFLEQGIFKQEDDKAPGDFGYGMSLYGKQFEGKLDEYRLKEIQNGRLAMLAIMELLTHNVLKPGDNLFDLNMI